ncbi:pilus assembly protein PilM [Thiocystis minor]|uniref:pilus assembly protein PilM n=1 Tax=Thiocystis minor TaxID=61597 RepID=UPI00191296DD|nr:pilus assembly protein PilM [Thiocystis minor]MBK5966597.1 pilus assembly protein PilM [Thiocystis minor]
MFGFSRKNSPLLGIDISSTAIKLVELSKSTGTASTLFRVEHSAIELLPLNAVVEKKIADPELVGQSIRKTLVKAGTKTKRAAIAVAGSAVITKVISMSASLSDAEMESQIQLEADQYIPYPLEEVNLDFEVIGTSSASPEMVDVLLAASRRENVDDRVAALEIAGLTAIVVDVEAYAMENACSLLLMKSPADEGNHRTVAIVDIGAATTTLHVLHKGQIIYTREQNFGGQQLKDEVQRRYGLSREEATQKILNGDVSETYEAEVLNPFKEALAQQIGRALQFFYSGTTFNRVDQILLSGGPASIRKIDVLVEDRLKLPTVVANPFSQMSLSPSIQSQELMREAPAMMVAVGLALRGFDDPRGFN